MQPDVEIYIKSLNAEQLSSWLEEYFAPINSEQLSHSLEAGKQFRIELLTNNEIIPLTITPNAAGKAFTSLWFQSDSTQWQSDLECAESALNTMGLEVRCSAESWSEEEEEYSEKWWKLTPESRELIVWG